MTRELDVVVERDERGYYVASVPTPRGCHTQARSLDKLITRVQEAIELCLEVEGEPGREFGICRCAAGSDRRVSRLPSITGKQVIGLPEVGVPSRFAFGAATTTCDIPMAVELWCRPTLAKPSARVLLEHPIVPGHGVLNTVVA